MKQKCKFLLYNFRYYNCFISLSLFKNYKIGYMFFRNLKITLKDLKFVHKIDRKYNNLGDYAFPLQTA